MRNLVLAMAVLLAACDSTYVDSSSVAEPAANPEAMQPPPPSPSPTSTPTTPAVEEPPALDEIADIRPEDGFRPRNFDFAAHCQDASVDGRLPPSLWFDNMLDTREKVFEEYQHLYAISSTDTLIHEHITFWETWCPATGWELPHQILLVGLYLLEDAYYYMHKYAETGDLAYERANILASEESLRYFYDGMRDSIAWYGDMAIYGEDPRVNHCLLGGRMGPVWMPLCDDYIGPILDPEDGAYNPDHPTVTEYIESKR